MAHIIEAAKSGRAKCQKCRQSIAKGDLRFGEETVNTFSDSGEMTYRWYHLLCAAKQRPRFVQQALDDFAGDIPNRAELDKELKGAMSKEKPGAFPYAERAPSGRSKCLVCSESIVKDSLRVAVEREVDTGSFVTTSAGYLHPSCAPEYLEDTDGLMDQLRSNSITLSKDDLQELATALQD